MGQTPLALIVLENQGNYTNPIHQKQLESPRTAEHVGQSGYLIHNNQTQAFVHI